MTSIRRLKIVAGCGEPDSVPALQLDVVLAAERLIDAQVAAGHDCCDATLDAMDRAEDALERAVRRLRRARAKRGAA